MIDASSSKPEGITIQWNGKPLMCFPRIVLVKLTSASVSHESIRSIESELLRAIPGSSIQKRSRDGERLRVEVPDDDVAASAKEISLLSFVEYAEPDVVESTASIPNDPEFGRQWGLPQIRCPDAWELSRGKPRVLIGIIDSGISISAASGLLDHPDLSSARILLGTDFVDGGTPRDENGHGTHVIGIASADSNNSVGVCGTCWEASLFVCRIFNANGTGSSFDFYDAAKEIVDHAVRQRMRCVINYSGGGDDNQFKRDACRYANDRGAILCAATGNNYSGPVKSPALHSLVLPNVIAVGATDSTDVVANFSNVGPEVTVVAPGVGILSTSPTYPVTIPFDLNYASISGTSMATPFVTGSVALILSVYPYLSCHQVRECLKATAKKLSPDIDFDPSWGYGRIDIARALEEARRVAHWAILTPFVAMIQAGIPNNMRD